jgi:hypothetical protein
MICILKQNAYTLEIVGWIIATDCHDARRQAEMVGEQSLAAAMYRMEFAVTSKCELPIPGPFRYTLLPG